MELEQAIIQSTMEVFASMIFIDIIPDPLVHPPTEAVAPELSSLIGLAGDLKGLLAIHCPGPVALGITSAMLGMEVEELGEDAKDAIGEIANMVAGGLKEALAAENRKIELAIPTTVIGKAVRTSGLSGASRLMPTFTCPVGRFGIELRYVVD